MEYDGVVVRRINVVNRCVCARLGTAELTTDERVEGPLDVTRGQRLSVVKAHTGMQVEDVGLRIGNFPIVSQPRLQVEVLIAPDEGIEEQLVNPLRLRVNPDPGIEVGRAAFDDHDQRVGIGLARATGKKKQQADQREQAGDYRDPSTRARNDSAPSLRMTTKRGFFQGGCSIIISFHPERCEVATATERSRRTPIVSRPVSFPTHSSLCPGLPASAPRLQKARSTACGATSDTPATRRRPLLSPRRASRTRHWCAHASSKARALRGSFA